MLTLTVALTATIIAWQTPLKLAPSFSGPSEFANAQFGTDCAIGDGMYFVSAPGNTLTPNTWGKVFAFDLETNELLREIIPSNNTAYETYGAGLVVHNGLLYTGCTDAQRTVICAIDPNTNRITQQYTPPNNASASSRSVTIDGNEIAYLGYDKNLSSPPIAYVFDLDTGTLRIAIETENAIPYSRGTVYSIAMNESIIAIGQPSSDSSGLQAGAVYLFERSGGSFVGSVLPPTPTPLQGFGNDIVIYAERLFITAPLDLKNSTTEGAVYVFNLNSNEFEPSIVPNDIEPSEQFGNEMHLADGSIFVSSSFGDGTTVNAGTVREYDAETLVLQTEYLNTSTFSGGGFGRGLHANKDLLVIGEPFSDRFGQSAGAVKIYTRGKALPATPDVAPPALGDGTDTGLAQYSYGYDVAISAEHRLVGSAYSGNARPIPNQVLLYPKDSEYIDPHFVAYESPELDSFGRTIALNDTYYFATGKTASTSRSILAFNFDSRQPAFILTPPDQRNDNQFGSDIAATNTHLIVGSEDAVKSDKNTGAAHLYSLSTRLPLELAPSGVSDSAKFGNAVAVNNTSALVGAYRDSTTFERAGSAHLFLISTGELVATLTAPDRGERHLFGSDVALSNSLAVIGAPRNDQRGDSAGAAYVYSTTSGTLLHQLFSQSPNDFDRFGQSVAVSDYIIAIGAPGWNDKSESQATTYSASDSNNNRGAVEIFDASNGRFITRLQAPDTLSNDDFGFSVATEGWDVIVGAPGHDQYGENAGSAYVFTICPSDLNSDSILDFADIRVFISLYLDANLIVDLNVDGILDLKDIQSYIAAFLAGC